MELRLAHRFAQDDLDAGHAGSLVDVDAYRGEQHQPGRRDGGFCAYGAGELDAVHAWHLHVQDRQVVSLPTLGRGPQ